MVIQARRRVLGSGADHPRRGRWREGFLILFDRSPRPWAEKLFESEARGPTGQVVHVLGI